MQEGRLEKQYEELKKEKKKLRREKRSLRESLKIALELLEQHKIENDIILLPEEDNEEEAVVIRDHSGNIRMIKSRTLAVTVGNSIQETKLKKLLQRAE